MVMKAFHLSLLAATTVLLLLLPVPGRCADDIQQSSTSKHTVKFDGDNWAATVQQKEEQLREILVSDIDRYVQRNGSFLTEVLITSFDPTHNFIEILIVVVQTVRAQVSNPERQHIWPPAEVNSLITQTDYSKTLSLYEGVKRPELISVKVHDGKLHFGECDDTCRRLLKLAMVVIILMGVSLLILIIYLIVNCCRGEPKEKDESNANHPYNQDHYRTEETNK
ncbi:hypothetical protein, conserved [Trypanosoma brucei brucei TREU927]|uniref:Uncharacterized protein n=1 Tax=Trypanosoma brucei brucei (strain 927/4 GUTat10.1) TaxID=185431 RepID=Q57UQ7_TRYB2|nr:hypothetical protein, conserved [Trypanosoma brucei brucei TREU927]AAX70662.1 hypothetical protein, conserved [Trypanosoma brucei]AAZ12491.1 hypothetical protein, conserved [Trypanosoma brucei brucei TREU927]